MEFSELQPILALSLGAIGTSLGLVNLLRDVRKNTEKVSVLAVPVLRRRIDAKRGEIFENVVSEISMNTTDNIWRNLGMKSVTSIKNHLENSEIPNLIGFEVRNQSTHSVFIHTLGLADETNKNKYESDLLDAIQELKAERVEGDPVEIKPKSLFTTYLYIDELVSGLLKDGYIYPVVETTSRNKRIYGHKKYLSVLSKWMINKHECDKT